MKGWRVKISANGVDIEIEERGLPDGMPLLLIMGLGMQLVGWPDELVEMLVPEGCRVIRFDNCDVGLGQGFDEHGVPNLPWLLLKDWFGLPITNAPYTIDDMALDAVGVLDALGIKRAHICGASMGGMIAQTLAAHHPQRVKSLTLMMTSSGARNLPRPSWKVLRAVTARPPRSQEAAIEQMVHVFNVIGGTRHRPDPVWLRRIVEISVRRALRPAGVARQIWAIGAHGDRTSLLSRIVAPTMIIHGSDEPLVRVAAAFDLHRKIAGAEIWIIDGMGHDLPPQLAAEFAQSIIRVAARATAVSKIA